MIFAFVVLMTVSHNRKVVAQHKTPLDYIAVRKTASYADDLLILLTVIRKYGGCGQQGIKRADQTLNFAAEFDLSGWPAYMHALLPCMKA